jgi:hypothetical protein
MLYDFVGVKAGKNDEIPFFRVKIDLLKFVGFYCLFLKY